jgi:hypothetical protein
MLPACISSLDYSSPPVLTPEKTRMNRDPIEPGPSSAGLPGVLRLTAGLAILALAVLAALVVLDAVPREQLTNYGTRILLLALIVALAAVGIGGLVRWGRRR